MHTLWTQDEYTRTYLFAARAHRDQKWPGDKELNYLVHITLVSIEIIAALQAELGHNCDLAIKCALLHDVIEDTEVTYEQIKAEFGLEVADGVKALSKNHALNNSLKMADSLRRIQQRPPEVQMVKMADRIVNLLPPPGSWDREKVKNYTKDAVKIHNALKSASAYLAERLYTKIQLYRQFQFNNTAMLNLD